MKKKELKLYRTKELPKVMNEIAEKRVEINKAILNLKIAKEKNLKKAKNLKRDLSQILTIIREKQIEGETK
jgi:hypothetical protein